MSSQEQTLRASERTPAPQDPVSHQSPLAPGQGELFRDDCGCRRQRPGLLERRLRSGRPSGVSFIALLTGWQQQQVRPQTRFTPGRSSDGVGPNFAPPIGKSAYAGARRSSLCHRPVTLSISFLTFLRRTLALANNRQRGQICAPNNDYFRGYVPRGRNPNSRRMMPNT